MVVDDEEDVRALTVATLSNIYEVVEAHDGLDALEKLERYQPDFIIMDVMMPLMTGLDASTAIRDNPKFNYVPILFLSALSTREDMTKAYRSGADLYLTKPIDPSHLLSTVQNFFKKITRPPQKKKFTIEQLHEMAKTGVVPESHPPQPAPQPKPAPQPAPKPTAHEHVKSEFQNIADKQPVAKHKESPYVTYKADMPPRIMVVDDDPDMVDFIKMSLHSAYEVVSASDGLEAIRKLVLYQPDLFLLDIMLPKMSGYQLCQSLRRNNTFRNSPILIVSAKSTQKDIDYAKRMGADSYLTKPFTPKEMLDMIADLIKRRQVVVRSKTLSINDINKREMEEKRVVEAKEERILKKKDDHEEKNW